MTTLVKAEVRRYFAATRQLTGTPYIHHAYVYDRETGKPVLSCTHRHGRVTAAWTCAERMLRRVLCRGVQA